MTHTREDGTGQQSIDPKLSLDQYSQVLEIDPGLENQSSNVNLTDLQPHAYIRTGAVKLHTGQSTSKQSSLSTSVDGVYDDEKYMHGAPDQPFHDFSSFAFESAGLHDKDTRLPSPLVLPNSSSHSPHLGSRNPTAVETSAAPYFLADGRPDHWGTGCKQHHEFLPSLVSPPLWQHRTPLGTGRLLDLGIAQESDSLASPEFRFKVVLHAATAMNMTVGDQTTTYLNKGTTYWISTQDCKLGEPVIGALFKSTFRCAFDSLEQVENAVACHHIWGSERDEDNNKEIQAIECVGLAEKQNQGWNVKLECSSFDRFSVTWARTAATTTNFRIPIRLNFLSTDFSASKKTQALGIRLCAQTQEVFDDSLRTSSSLEGCYALVKLFRPHGAERKLANDILSINKAIGKSCARREALDTSRKAGKLAVKSKVDQRDEEIGVKISELEQVLASSKPVTSINRRIDAAQMESLNMDWGNGVSTSRRRDPADADSMRLGSYIDNYAAQRKKFSRFALPGPFSDPRGMICGSFFSISDEPHVNQHIQRPEANTSKEEILANQTTQQRRATCLLSYSNMKFAPPPTSPSSSERMPTDEKFPAACIHILDGSQTSDCSSGHTSPQTIYMMRPSIADLVFSVIEFHRMDSSSTASTRQLLWEDADISSEDDATWWLPENQWIRAKLCVNDDKSVLMTAKYLSADVRTGHLTQGSKVLIVTVL